MPPNIKGGIMKKYLFLISVLCLCLLCACNETAEQSGNAPFSENDISTTESAETETVQASSYASSNDADIVKYVAKNGVAYERWKLNIVASEFVDPEDYVGEGPFDFFGVSIIEFEKGRSSYSDREVYSITLSHELDTFDTAEYLQGLDGIIQAVPKLSTKGSDWTVYDWSFEVDESPYKEYTEDERKRFELFIPDEFTVQFNHELDLSEFEGEGTHYLIGVAVSEISRIEDAEGFVYRLKLGEQKMFNIGALAVFETNDDVLYVEFESLYGKGDINEDGTVDSEDCLLIEQIAQGTKKMTYWTAGYADINIDGNVDMTDYQLLKERISD